MRSTVILPAGSWDAARAADTVKLDFDRRHRRRIMLRTDAGQDVLLDLAQAARLRDGDGLVLDQGGVVRVQAQAEALAEVHAHGEGDLVRIAWHLGNRHLPVQLLEDRIRIRVGSCDRGDGGRAGRACPAHRSAVRPGGRRLCRRAWASP